MDGESSEVPVSPISKPLDSHTPERPTFKAQLERFAYTPPTKTAVNGSPDMASRRSTLRRPKVESASPGELAQSPADGPLPKGFSRKRSMDSEDALSSASSTVKKKRSTAKQRSANDPHNPTNKLVDSLRPGLILVFIGLNPGLTTATTGHAYAHPSNRFWYLLEASGVTPVKHRASETQDLMDLYSIGNTNICARPTRDGSGLTKDELVQGARILEAKIQQMKPEAVAIVGKQIWEALWKAKMGKALPKAEFKWGWQDEHAWLGRTKDEKGKVTWRGSRTFVTTSTSGLSATLSPAEKLAIWKPLGDWFAPKREQMLLDREEV